MFYCLNIFAASLPGMEKINILIYVEESQLNSEVTKNVWKFIESFLHQN